MVAGLVATAFAAGYRLWPLGTPSSPASIDSLAIVTFTNYGPVDDAHFSAGLTDAVVAALASRSEIPIRSLDAGKSGGNATNPLPRRALESDAVLTGGYMRAGNTLRVTARLDESRTGRALWAGTRDFPAGNVLRLQDEVTQWLATSLSRELPGTSSSASQRPFVPAREPKAWEDHLEARHLVRRAAAAGIPTVDVGPSGAGAHELVEWVDLRSTVSTAAILVAAALRFQATAR
jgi:TolB-like protein